MTWHQVHACAASTLTLLLSTACLEPPESPAAPPEPASPRALAAPVGGTTDVPEVFPPASWATPTLRADADFPGGVLQFATGATFTSFYRAFDAAAAANRAGDGHAGATPYAASGTASATTAYKSFTVQLQAGQLLELGTCDLEGSSFTGDTYLRVVLAGAEVAANDDACAGLGSRLSYTAATSGTYEIRMGCYSSSSCSGLAGYSIATPAGTRTGTGARSYSAAATGGATTGYSTLVLDLTQGQVLDVGTCGGMGPSHSGDTLLRLIDLDGQVELTSNDNACGGLGSRLSYTADRTGTFEVRLGCAGSTACSGNVVFTLSPELTPKQMLPPMFFSAADALAARPAEPPGDTIRDVDYAELELDIKEHLAEDEALRSLLDPALQVVVEGKLYQLTSVGLFQVELSALPEYRNWLAANASAMNSDPAFTIPGEIALGGGSYQVLPGVIRTVGAWGLPELPLLAGDPDTNEPLPAARPTPQLSPKSKPEVSTKDPGPVIAGEIGRISYWYGKVNTRRAINGPWLRDEDCTSGANLDPLAYCRKFFPNTTSAIPVAVSPKPPNLWATAGCTELHSGDGFQEWICDGVGGPPPDGSCNQPNPSVAYHNHTVDEDFRSRHSVYFGNRRFRFKTQSINLSAGSSGGFRKIGIKGKLQRKKRFLGIAYWGPSYADEIVVGVDNMKLETDYIVPKPQTYNVLPKPQFSKLADYKLGNHLIQVAGITWNVKVAGYSITQQNLADWGNNLLNSLIGNVYNNIWKYIEDNIMDSIDPGFRTRYAAYTKMVEAINDANKLRWAIGHASKPKCYSHQNTWTFDVNFGFSIKKNGGVPGPPGTPPAKINYKYSMKAGAFYGRARVGSAWYGVRVVRQ